MLQLVLLVVVARAAAASLVLLDLTECYECGDPGGCSDPVVGGQQLNAAINWTLARMERDTSNSE